MIKTIHSYDACRDFVAGFQNDPVFSDPMCVSEEQLQGHLIGPISRPDCHYVLGIYREDRLTGLFSFLTLHEDKVIEMLVGLSREKDAYREAFDYLHEHYAGYEMDCVFNPRNHLIKELLEERKAVFDPEQQKMVLRTPPQGLDTTGVELLTGKYLSQYCAIHDQEMYWVGEKVAEATHLFRTFVAIHEEKVVGYLDITHPHDENEIYDLFVLEEYRRKGFGRKLLAKAIEANHPKGLTLLVDVDNTPAIRLYESMGMIKVEGRNSQVAYWTI